MKKLLMVLTVAMTINMVQIDEVKADEVAEVTEEQMDYLDNLVEELSVEAEGLADALKAEGDTLREQSENRNRSMREVAKGITSKREVMEKTGNNAKNLGNDVLEKLNFVGNFEEMVTEFRDTDMNIETLSNVFQSLGSEDELLVESELGEGILQVLGISETKSRLADTVRQVIMSLLTLVFFSIAFAIVKGIRVRNEYKTF
ncbi:hypothetical protein IRB23SM22_07120 [Alkalibacterium sp. s-m-22]